MKKCYSLPRWQSYFILSTTCFLLASCVEEKEFPEPSPGEPVPGEVDTGISESAAPESSNRDSSPEEQLPAPADPGDEKAAGETSSTDIQMKEGEKLNQAANTNLEVATIGGGCFWCTEAVLEQVEGVKAVVSGYMGGHVENPTYEQICTKTTGHAEVIQVTYDKTVLTFEDVLDIFWQAHDPTTLNQQGADKGPQYRSVIFYHSPEQKNLAEKSRSALDMSGVYDDPSVTEITKASTFWEAEDYHQDYYKNNKENDRYCRLVITPKMKKLGFE